ncbi:MAG: class I SAM-dependent methyltransferase [Hyphomonadaceae bacterium]
MTQPVTQREYWNSPVGEEWARQADRTDKMFAELTRAGLDALALQPGERVLDIGCGAGETALTIARKVGPSGRAAGIDISRPLLELARERAQAEGFDVDFIDADAGAAAIPGAPFDAAFSRFGVMFFDDAIAAFSHIRTSLRSGGRLVFLCWRPFSENAWSYAAAQALTPLLPAPLQPADESLPGPFFFADPNKIKTILAASGWRDVSVDPWDGNLIVGADAKHAAGYLLKIGPCARAIKEYGLDPAAAEKLMIARLAQAQTPAGVSLAAACWIARAMA